MYEIIRLEAAKDGKPRYAVINSKGQTLCEFGHLYHTCLFMRFLMGAEVTSDESAKVFECIFKYNKICKKDHESGGCID